MESMECESDSSDIDLKLIINKYFELFIIDLQPLIREPLTSILDFKGLQGRSWQQNVNYKEQLIRLIQKSSPNKTDDRNLLTAFRQVAKECGYQTFSLLLQPDIPPFENFCIEFADHFRKSCVQSFCEETPYSLELLNRLETESLLCRCDSEGIKQRKMSEGETDALGLLCCRVPARHPRWLPLLYKVLFEMKLFHAIGAVDATLFKALNEITNLSELDQISPEIQEEAMKCVELHIESLIGQNEARKAHSLDTDSGGDGTSSDYLEVDCAMEDKSFEEVLYLRNYQMELVERALQGKNTIICAPTNSGKTYMATHIILEHLKKNPHGKVVFLVHRVALVNQQAKVIERYLDKEKFKVGRASGIIKDDENIVSLVQNVNILVCTAGLLLNAFEEKNLEKKLESVTTFSLMIFDECHNCTQHHVYQQIMQRYLSAKSTQLSSRLPQVVGITASFGTNKASDLSKAVGHIVTVMRNMDCKSIDVVKRNKEELQQYLPEPLSGFILTKDRSDDRFEAELVKIMKLAESSLTTFQRMGYFKQGEDITSLIRSIPNDRSSILYTNFVGSLRYLHFRAHMEPRDYRSDIVAIYEILNVFNEAFKINRLFRSKDAVTHLIDNLQLGTNENKFSQVRDKIYKIINDSGLLNETTWTHTNPVLDEVKEKLLEQFQTEPDSRIIVFVKARAYVTYLKDSFGDDKRFEAYGYGEIVGARNTDGRIKITQAEQSSVIDDFKSGVFKILFATNVIEEGLDVPSCNMVIRYSHITNEISMQQSKGRARAKNSQYWVLVPKGQEWLKTKEEANVKRKELEDKALAKIAEMEGSDLEELIDGRANRKNVKVSGARNYDTSRTYVLKCRGCQKEICEQNDIKSFEVHHFMVNEAKLSNLFTKIRDDNDPQKRVLRGGVEATGKIHCGEATCKRDLGNIMSINKVSYPNLKLSCFSVFDMQRNTKNDKGLVIKQWKDSPFQVSPLEVEEINDRYDRIGNDWLSERLME